MDSILLEVIKVLIPLLIIIAIVSQLAIAKSFLNEHFIKDKKNNLSIFNLIIYGSVFALIILIFLYSMVNNEFELNNVTHWGNVGSFFGGLTAPIITFLTILFLIQQIKAGQESTRDQIIAAQESTDKQINYMKTLSEIEELKNIVYKISENIEEIQKEKFEQPKSCIDQIIKISGTCSVIQDYKLKKLDLTYGDELFFYEWKGAIDYLRYIINDYPDSLKKKLEEEISLKIKCIDILSKINKLVYFCEILLMKDNNSTRFIFMILSTFKNTVNTLFNSKLMDEQMHQRFYLYFSLHGESSIPFNTFKTIFIKEINIYFSSNITKIDSLTHKIESDGKNIKYTTFKVIAQDTIYYRKKGVWSKDITP